MKIQPIKILVSESRDFSSLAYTMLQSIGHVTLADLERQTLLTNVVGMNVLWIRLRHQIDHEVFCVGSDLKYIVSPTTGLNHIDLEEAHNRGIQIISLRGEIDFLKEVRATAEHTLALLFALIRRLPGAVQHVQKGGWNRDLYKGYELWGKVAGVVGYGRLGQIVARYLAGLGMQVLTFDPNIDPGMVDPEIAYVPFEELLSRSDVVTLHVNYNFETHQFFGWHEFSLMKPGSWFINTSRGELIVEDALLESLHRGKLKGAALDVLNNEESKGMRQHPLVEYACIYENLIITPHIGGCTVESMEKTEVFMAQKLVQILS